MPEICRFFGIIIKMMYNEHNPPHFHAEYQGEKAVFSINELKIIKGSIHPKAILLILEWSFEHREELLKDWYLAQKHEILLPIKPL